jgi:hypothetical protein
MNAAKKPLPHPARNPGNDNDKKLQTMKFIEASRSRARFAFLLVFLLLAAGIVCDFPCAHRGIHLVSLLGRGII